MQRKFPPIPPRAAVAKAVQPDYRKWKAVRPGMSRHEVTKLLGSPLSGREQRPHIYSNHDFFGFVSYPALPNKWSMLFSVNFDHEGRVASKTDPFGGVPPSRTGKPSKPKLITPLPASRFNHFPRLVDVRWFPCSGVYPIAYELEIGIANSQSDDFRSWMDWRQYGQPYAVIEIPGSQPARIRVRGINDRGNGPWSDYLSFFFNL